MSTSKYRDPALVLQYLLQNSLPVGECLEWQGRRIKGGYGQKWWPMNSIMVHRAVWEVTNGDIPQGYDVCHTCDNPPCLNIDHLFLATAKDNLADARKKKRTATGARNKITKLTEGQVKAIKKVLEVYPYPVHPPRGTWQRLADLLRVNPATIYQIWTGKAWSYLNGNS